MIHNDEHLPTLTTDQKKQFNPFISNYTILYNYSQQINQTINSNLHPIINNINTIHIPQNYITQNDPLHKINNSLNILTQQLQNTKLQTDTTHSTLKQNDNLKPIFNQTFTKIITTPTDTLQPLIPTTQTFTQQLMIIKNYITQQNTQINFIANNIQFPTSQQTNKYNKLITPLPTQHQTFNQT